MIKFRILDHMQKRQLRTADLARLANVNRSTITALASQRATRVELAALERICRVLGCQIGELLEISEDRESSRSNEIIEKDTQCR